MGHRRHAREAAMQMWYQIDLGQLTVDAVWTAYCQQHPMPPDMAEFTHTLVFGVAKEQEIIDALIAEHSTHWRLSRMSTVDRNVLRVAVFELMHCADIPLRVTLNEAIEIGKKFGTEESGAFINGILDQIARDLKKPLD